MREKVANWLNGLNPTHNAVPVEVTIGTETFQGAKYKNHSDEITYYLIGSLPKCYQRRKSTAFRFPGSDKDWYVGAYVQSFEKLDDQKKSYHQFGNHFLLFCWNNEQTIDYGERHQYKRVQIAETS